MFVSIMTTFFAEDDYTIIHTSKKVKILLIFYEQSLGRATKWMKRAVAQRKERLLDAAQTLGRERVELLLQTI